MEFVTVKLPDGSTLANRIRVARQYFERLRGLLGTTHLDRGEGILLEHCSSIHTIGMSMTIDVVFLDQEDHIKRICHAVRPGKIRIGTTKTVRTLELASGLARDMNLTINQRLRVQSI